MKTATIRNRHGRKALLLHATLTACLGFLGGITPAKAGEILNSDFSKGSFEALGWTPKGEWEIVDYAVKTNKPGLPNNPGPVAVFTAKNKTPGTLTKKFDAAANPSSLTLTFDAGYGWGAKNHPQALQVMILDAEGNGYIFNCGRANAAWAVGWGDVSRYAPCEKLETAPQPIDATQDSVVTGGGLRTFTITRDASGKWTFNGAGWTGGPLTFTDTEISNFSQIVLVGQRNSDELLFNKIKLDAAK
ncbi:MAG: hypothetical protein WC003_00505 [Terrimicrobiaceae bacterium]